MTQQALAPSALQQALAPSTHLLDGVGHTLINHKQVLTGGKGGNHASDRADVIAACSKRQTWHTA